MNELYLNKIKSLLREKHITQEQVCKKIGIQQPTLSVMLSGRAPLSKTVEKGLSEILGFDITNLNDKLTIIQTNNGNAGNNISMNIDGYKSEYIEPNLCCDSYGQENDTPIVPTDIMRKTDVNVWKFVNENINDVQKITLNDIFNGYDLFYRVISDAMKPTIEKGDMLILRRLNVPFKIIGGDCYMIDTVDYGCVVRMLYYENGVYSCKANIPEYSDITLSDNEIYNIFSIVGLVRPLVTPRSDYKDKIFELKTKDIQINELIDNIGKLIDHITKK